MLTITDKEFIQLASFIKNNYGINLKEEKKALVIGRLNNVLSKMGFDNFTDYFEYIVSDKNGDAITTLVNKITTNHTFFMREADHFYYFRDRVLPQLVNQVRDKDLRIWSAACSSGEEPYTLAMIIDEFLGNSKKLWDAKILATDISQNVLDIARAGQYSSEQVTPLPKHWQLNYFSRVSYDIMEVKEFIKQEVIFRKFNLVDTVFPFKKKFHAIFCRNVMIYFDQHTKQELVNKLYDQLTYGGYLFIGHSESLARDMTKFKYIMPAVYQKQ